MKYKCNECGAEMIDQSKGPYLHYVCPKCGNSIATYDFNKCDPVLLDEQIYSVKMKNNDISLDILKMVSKITGYNFIKCKETIKNEDVILTGKAREIASKLNELKANNIEFVIDPSFNYKI